MEIGMDGAQTADRPGAPMPEVVGAFSALEEQVAAIRKITAILEDRLERVMRPGSSEDGGKDRGPTPLRSPLAGAMRALEEELHVIRRRLSEYLDRLEV